MMNIPEPSLMDDPQQQKERRCPVCDTNVFAPTYFCPRCERRANEAIRIKPRL